MEKLSLDQIEQLRKILIESKTEIESQLILNLKNSEVVQLDQSKVGRLSRMDAMQQQKMAEASKRSSQKRLEEIKNALNNIDQDDFGECRICGEYISFKRLLVRPESFLCIECKETLEST